MSALMNNWQDDLLMITDTKLSETQIIKRIQDTAEKLEFEYCAYGLQLIFPEEKVVMFNNYPQRWQKRYASENYLAIDPSVAKGRQSQTPLIWSDELFRNTKVFWEEARAAGLKVGWAQSITDAASVASMLTLSRSSQPITRLELEANEIKMRWLVNVAHITLSKRICTRLANPHEVKLTSREKEVLKWTGSGKTSFEISCLLAISENTVNFHIKNSILKLSASNKTAAVVQAFLTGLLN